MADYIRPVVFRLGDQEFGVDINLVQSIEKQVNVVPVPNSMKYISGIVNLRGEVIPVMSLKEKFNMEDQSKGDNTEYLDRVASIDNKLVILLDINKILSEEEAQGIKEFTGQMKNN